NFLFEGMQASFRHVPDSLTAAEVDALRSRFLLLATNPPFGAGKYRWNERLKESMDSLILEQIGVATAGQATDPSGLFFFRNLDLLAPKGVLAIVLPDGVVQSTRFCRALRLYEQVHDTALHVAAVVSLPAVTFSLGGTVAKTSFVLIQKDQENAPLYAA